MATVDAVVTVLRVVAEAHDATPSQVALAWLIAKGTVPIPGAKNADQARQNAGCLAVDLTVDELTALDAVSLEGVRSLQNRVWQHG
jgi:aryl-alcohol dehydrogenase-like predicted oxidoreductase